tara:strand:- start:33048 stop:33791 length:744 start_codon:yes stop_codon:yes gene_type:complete
VPKKNTKYFSLPKTLFTSTLIFLAFSLSQMLILGCFLISENKEINQILSDQNLIESQAYNYINPISIFSSLFGILLIIILAKYILISPNNSKIKLNEIIPIDFPPIKLIFFWLFVLFGFSILISISSNWLELFNETTFTNQILSSSNNILLLFYGIGIAQPIFEELLFRGLLFKGLNERLGGSLTIIVTSILFVIPHIQYDFSILILVLFPNALILGLCRLKTKSLTIPIILHCVNNIFTLMIGIWN